MEFENSEFENLEFKNSEFENIEFENSEFENLELKSEKAFFRAGVQFKNFFGTYLSRQSTFYQGAYCIRFYGRRRANNLRIHLYILVVGSMVGSIGVGSGDIDRLNSISL